MRWTVFVLSVAGAAAQIPLPLDSDSLQAFALWARQGSESGVRDQLEDAARRAHELGDALSESWAQVGVAALLEHGHRPLLAESAVREAIERARDSDPLFGGRSALWMARESDRAGRLLRVRHWADIAAAEFRAAGDRRQLAIALTLAASASRGRDREELLREALIAAETGGNAREIAIVQAARGEFLRSTGDLASAIRALQEASRTLESSGAWSEASRALTLLARAHNAHGQRREALFQLNRAEALLAKTGGGAEETRIRIEMGNVLASLGERAKAMGNLEYARLAIEGHDPGLSSVMIHGYLTLGEHERVVKLVERLKQSGPRRAPAPALWMAAAALFHLGRWTDSADAATEALRIARQPDALSNVSAYRWRALSLDRLGRHEEAARDALEAVRLGETVLLRIAPDDEWKRAFVESKEDFAGDIVSVLWNAGRIADALEVAERFRARAFLDLIASRGHGIENTLATSTSIEPRLSSSRFAEPVPIAKIVERAAASNAFLLSYWVHRDCLFVWLLTGKGEIKPARVAISSARLGALVDRARQTTFKPDRAAWRELHRLLIEPVERWLPRESGPSLGVLAHGPLQRLPFGALIGRSGRYLIEDYRLRSVAAAGFVLHDPQPVSGPLVLIGAPANPPAGPDGRPLPPLPGAKAELERIATGKHTLLSGSSLRADRVRDEAARAGVLHFATHAVVDERRPFESFLPLSDGGKLTAGEVYRMRLSAGLVTLSACRGGSGRVSADGILGFPRAFLYAGAASVVAPLWDVPDATTGLLMEEFYRRIRSGASKSEALRSAQLKLLRELRGNRVSAATAAGPMPLPEHPALWAGFILMGAE